MNLLQPLKNLGISVKLIVMLAVLVTIIVTTISIVRTDRLKRLTLKIGQQRADEEAKLIRSQFTEEQKDLSTSAHFLANAPGFVEAVTRQDVVAVNIALRDDVVSFEENEVVVVDANGRLLTQGTQSQLLGTRHRTALLAIALQGIETTDIVIIEDEDASKSLILVRAIPVTNLSDQTVGGLLVSRKLGNNFLQELNASRSNVTLILISKGATAAASSAVASSAIDEAADAAVLAKMAPLVLNDLSALRKTFTGQTTTSQTIIQIDNVPHAVAYLPLRAGGEFNAVIAILINLADLAVIQNQLSIRSNYVIIFLILPSIFVILLFMRQVITVPLGKLGTAAEEMTAGNLTARAQVKAKDDIGRVAISFNKMAAQLQHVLTDLERLVAERTSELSQTNKLLMQEVSERQRADKALRESEERLRHVFNSISDYIYVSEYTSDGQWVNRYLSPVESLTGYQSEQILADWHFWSTIIYPDDRKKAATQAERFSQGLNSEVEYRLIRPDGSIIWVRDSGQVEKNPVTGSILIYGVVSDISERKEAEASLASAHDQALVASRLKSELLAKVSHELRTPLNAILGYTELLQNGIFGPITKKQVEITAEVIDSTQYLTNLVNELLDQAQLETGRLTLENNNFEPSALVQQVEAKMSVLAQAKGLVLEIKIAADLPPVISGDLHRLQQIVLNLVNNAIKFTESGSVQVHLSMPDARRWAIAVSDTGPGIPQEAQAYIFEPFRQVDGSATRIHIGTGLGLSIVEQLTSLMNGRIAVESQMGHGSTFTVYLPLIATTEQAV